MPGTTGDPFAFLTPSETELARNRLPTRLYLSRSFDNANPNSRDFGEASRFAYRVFVDDDRGAAIADAIPVQRAGECLTEEHVITTIGDSRTQVKALISREKGNVTDLYIQAVPASGKIRQVLHLRRDDVGRFLDFMRSVRLIEPEGGEEATRVDDYALEAVLSDPRALELIYGQSAGLLRELVACDAEATDVIAIAHRKAVLSDFEFLLYDEQHFREAQGVGGPERVWQAFFESESWLLGIGLTEQLLTSWDDDRLETVVAGFDIGGRGKRADALMRTAGLVRSMVFAEVKHHDTPLLGREYRPGNFPPSSDLVGGVAQSQGTVHEAVERLRHRIQGTGRDGFDIPNDYTYLVRPRCFLIAGSLGQLLNDSGAHDDNKVKSFELYRRHTIEPEIITFDELLERARWIVAASASPNRRTPGADAVSSGG